MSTIRMFWGAVLVVIGLFFLADNLGFLPFNPNLLWPVLLILLGVFIILAARGFGGSDGELQSITLPLEGAQRATIKIEHGAGRVRLHGATPKDQLLSGDFRYLELRATRAGDTANLLLRTRVGDFFPFIFPWYWGATRHEWDFALNPDIPISLELDTGASESVLDLRQLRIERLDLDTGASSTKIVVPAAAGFTRVDVDSCAASLDITIPDGVAADIHIDSGLGSVSVDQQRFPRSGGRNTSPDYATAVNKVEINIDTGVSSTTIR